MTDWRWISLPVILAIHDRQIAEHGGLSGLRDNGAMESALARPLNVALYDTPDAADLAAAYAFGLARNHPFADALASPSRKPMRFGSCKRSQPGSSTG